MRYCEVCQTGVRRQVGKFCFWCGSKLVDMPTIKCECNFLSSNQNAFCIMCGKELKIKPISTDILKEVDSILEKDDKGQ